MNEKVIKILAGMTYEEMLCLFHDIYESGIVDKGQMFDCAGIDGKVYCKAYQEQVDDLESERFHNLDPWVLEKEYHRMLREERD